MRELERHDVNEGVGKRRARRWGVPVPVAQFQPQNNRPEYAASSAIHIIEPHVSDAEAIAALVGSSSGGSGPATLKDKGRKRSEYSDNEGRVRKRRWTDSKSPGFENDIKLASGQDRDTGDIGAPDVPVEKEKANFGLSGALATDSRTGNTVNGIVLKFTEPPEARIPDKEWRLYLFNKNDKSAEPFKVLAVNSKSAYLIGRDAKVADIPLLEADGQTISKTCSKQHCVLQYRGVRAKHRHGTYPGDENEIECKPYLMDLKSTNGTFINGTRLEDSRYYELMESDVVTVGRSDVEYVILRS